MNKKTRVLILTILGFVSTVQASDEPVEGSKKEQTALRVCEKIGQDHIWTQELTQMLKRQDTLIRNNERPVNDLLHHSQEAFRATALDISRESKGKSREYIEYLIRQIALRSLQSCGSDLRKNGGIFIYPGMQDKLWERVGGCIVKNESTIEQVKRNQAMTSAEKESVIVSSEDCRDVFSDPARNGLIYPLHLVAKGGEKKFAERMDDPSYKSRVALLDKSVDEAKKSMADKAVADERNKSNRIAREAQSRNERAERDERIKKIQNGNLTVAQTCGEIAEGLIPEREIVANMAGSPISRDSQKLNPNPNKIVYATLGKLLSMNSRQAKTFDVNQLSGEKYSYVLNFSKNTQWFKNQVPIGGNIYFVGRYVDNGVVSIKQGMNEFDVSARVYDVICASSL